MKNIMKRAWEIYRTLTGTHLEKLSAALRKAWAEFKAVAKSMKEKCIDRLNTIIKNSSTYDYCELFVVANDWIKYGKNRTYIKIVEASKNSSESKHYVERDYGYIDNVTNEYVPSKNNCFDNFTFGGMKF